MGLTKNSPVTGIATSFQDLAASAKKLNTVSDKLGVAMGAVDDALRQLGLGVAGWAAFRTDYDPESGANTHVSLGYCKLGGKWGIGVRRSSWRDGDEEDCHTEEWIYNDAPRDLRLESIKGIPALIATLLKETNEKIKQVEDGVKQATEFASFIQFLNDPDQRDN